MLPHKINFKKLQATDLSQTAGVVTSGAWKWTVTSVSPPGSIWHCAGVMPNRSAWFSASRLTSRAISPALRSGRITSADWLGRTENSRLYNVKQSPPTYYAKGSIDFRSLIPFVFLQSARGRFRFLMPPFGTTCLPTSHMRHHLRFSDNNSRLFCFPIPTTTLSDDSC